MPGSRATPLSAGAARSERRPPSRRLRYPRSMRALVMSDIHANIEALDAVLAAAPSVDEVWHLGDVVGYGPEPDAVVGRLRDIGAVGVRGNHDAAALGGDEIESFNVDARRAMEWTRTAITDPTKAWLASLPERLVRGDWTLVHGSPRDPIWEYITSSPVARAAFSDLETAHGLHGHTHVPIGYLEEDGALDTMSPGSGSVLELGGRRGLLNPGSVGQPRDGIPAASWLVLDTDTGTATWHRTAYDISAVQTAMEALRLPGRLVERLSYGL
jgi:predicted phosphodiesterase